MFSGCIYACASENGAAPPQEVQSPGIQLRADRFVLACILSPWVIVGCADSAIGRLIILNLANFIVVRIWLSGWCKLPVNGFIVGYLICRIRYAFIRWEGLPIHSANWIWSGLAFIVSGRRKAVKALYKACKRFYDISPHGTAKCGLNAIKSASEDFLKPAVTGIQISLLCLPAGNYPAVCIWRLIRVNQDANGGIPW